jgi:cellulose synthase/poly-beta-1,6-N-acetylglucosamine synthase-like glycosyltransferase
MNDYYLKISRASDLKNPKERFVYRIFEIFSGAFSWLTLISCLLLSRFQPVWAAVFIITFVIYWLLRVIYFSFHLASCYKMMRENEETNWLRKLEELKEYSPPIKNWQDIYHLIVLPMYNEPLEIVSETFLSLSESDYPKEKMIVVLSCEERAGEKAKKIGEKIKNEFSNKFFKFLLTFHPANLPGEIAGKGSNDAWGSKEVKEKIIDPLKIPYQNIIVSSLDADTKVFPKYFSCLTYHYLTCDDPLHSSFQPVPLFLNNILQAPPISRIFAFSASFWEMMCQERPEKLKTFSSHSMSFKALVDVGFRQKNVVSDDSRIFWQCFLEYDGNYKVIPLYFPISMDANCAQNFLKTMKNVYLQQRRWAYGVADFPYYLFGFLKNRKIPLKKALLLGFTDFETFWSWATSSFVMFFMGWLPIVLGGERFRQTVLSHNLPLFTSRILTISMIGLVASAYFSILLIPKSLPLGKRKFLILILEWFLLPVIMIFFTSLPALEAQTRLMLGKYLGFYPTEKYRKK